MIEQHLHFYFLICLMVIAFLVTSVFIPFLGFIHKRWKGLAIGCVLQPIVFVLFCVAVVLGIVAFQEHYMNKQQKEAMIIIRKTVADGDDKGTHTWYLKDFEECLYIYENDDKNSRRANQQDRLLDVLPIDSVSVGIDDRIVVKFDMKKRHVTATDFDKPIEVIRVDWDKIHLSSVTAQRMTDK